VRQQHFEAMNPTRLWPVWALIAVCQGGGAALVLAACDELQDDLSELGSSASELCLTHPEEQGFYLWKGTGFYDGLDGVDYEVNTCDLLEMTEVATWLAKHGEKAK
jgi:hypothetical protein